MKKSNRNSLKVYLLLLPVVLFLTGIFVTGIVLGFVQSLGLFPVIGLNKLTLNYYVVALSDATFRSSLFYSLRTSLIQAVLSSVLGIIIAYTLVSSTGKMKNAVNHLYKLPVMIPHSIAALFVLLVFGGSGLLARLLNAMHLIENIGGMSQVIYDTFGTGVILAYVFKGAPFITLIIYEQLKEGYDQYAKVAKGLGASSYGVFVHILLPMIMPSLLSGFIILFVYALGAFEIPFLLGVSSPKAMTVLAYNYFNNIDLHNRPLAMVANMIISMTALIFLFIYHVIHRMMERQRMGVKL